MTRGSVDIEVIRVSIFSRDCVRTAISMLTSVPHTENRAKCTKAEWIKSGYMNNVFNHHMRDRKRDKWREREKDRVRDRKKASWSLVTGVEYVLRRTSGHGGTEVTWQSRGPLTSSDLEGVLKPIWKSWIVCMYMYVDKHRERDGERERERELTSNCVAPFLCFRSNFTYGNENTLLLAENKLLEMFIS